MSFYPPKSGPVNGNMVNDNAINAMGGTRRGLFTIPVDAAIPNDAAAFNTGIELPTTVIWADCMTFIPHESSTTYLTPENYNEVIPDDN